MSYGSNMSDKGRNMSDKGRNMPDKGRNISDKGRNMFDKGRNMCDKGRSMSDKGSTMSNKGRNMSDKGRNRSDKGRNISDKGFQIHPICIYCKKTVVMYDNLQRKYRLKWRHAFFLEFCNFIFIKWIYIKVVRLVIYISFSSVLKELCITCQNLVLHNKCNSVD